MPSEYEYKLTFEASSTPDKGGFTLLSSNESIDGNNHKAGFAQRRLLSTNARSAYSSLLVCGIYNKNPLWTQAFEWPSTLFSRPVYPLLRTCIRQYLFHVLPHFMTGTFAQWMNVDQFSNLHECATSDCPYHRIKNPKARQDIEDLAIDTAVKVALTDANGGRERPRIHLVSSHVGGLFTEAVLLSRLLADKRLPKETQIDFSLLGQYKPFVALVNKDNTEFEKILNEGYNQMFHEGTSAQLASFRQLFLGVPGLTIRGYGTVEGLDKDINLGSVAKKVDVFVLVDPGMEPYDIMRALAQTVAQASVLLCERGTYIAGHALGGRPNTLKSSEAFDQVTVLADIERTWHDFAHKNDEHKDD